MARLWFIVTASLVVAIVLNGCERQVQQCVAGDTPAVCKGFNECINSGTSVEVCRMGEKDASQPRRDLAPAYNGAADALKDDPSPKSPPQQSPKH